MINAGDGKHEHPTQALLDVFTLRRRLGSLDGANIWIVGDVLHSRVARSNILAFTRMGAQVTVCGPPTLIPREIEALGCAAHADARRGSTRPTSSTCCGCSTSGCASPSCRRCASTPRATRSTRGRLRPGQLLMHPGPVNRGVELSGDAIDSPQALIGEQVKAGVAVRMAVLYELLGRLPDAWRRWHEHEQRRPRLFTATGPPAELLIRGAHVLDPRAGLDEPHDVLIRDGADRRARRAGALTRARGRRDARRRPASTLFPGFVDPHVHLRTPGQEYKEDLETGTAAAAAGGFCAVIAMPNTDPVLDDAAVLRLAGRGRRGARPGCRSASWPRSPAGCAARS